MDPTGRLEVLPTLDSAAMAEANHRALWISRDDAAALGRSAVAAGEAGYYVSPSGARVEWREQVVAARAGKTSLAPGDALPTDHGTRHEVTRVQVVNETTLLASRRLVASGRRPLALNFANGIHPGGGFLHGARAQEEVLCRSSALYATLLGDPMYDHHRARPRPDSTDWAIHSPEVPVFRQDDGTALEEPWPLSVITCAAPVAQTIGQPESGDLLERRIHRVLAIARAFRYETLVLGAWGCGAFGNDRLRTAIDFRRALEREFCGAFAEVLFAISDRSPERGTLGVFRDVFAGEAVS